ncbi:MAG: GNAT family N-acetyltransferase [bacterium]|nr:GNAT family N-acetyltransferase [bacterium]
MNEALPIQKEFGEIERMGNKIQIKKFGSESISGTISLSKNMFPVPHYVAHFLWVGKKDQGKGLASQLMAEVERISRESGEPILLGDAVEPDQNPLAVGMYGKRAGWVQIPDSKGEPTSRYIYGLANPKLLTVFLNYYDRRF